MPIEYDQLEKNAANYVPLTPLSFLWRTTDIYPDRQSIIYNDRRYTWAETRERCTRLASSLAQRGIGKNDTVALFAFNTPEMFEAHFGVPMSGAVLNTINTRLDAATVAYIIDHGESRVFITDRELWPVVQDALTQSTLQPEIIIIDDESAATKPDLPRDHDFVFYEDFIANGDPEFSWKMPENEWQALSLNYTSGTTGRPKGVVYHHRGSYLMSMGTASSWNIPEHPHYLYSVPMFHCNGWGHAWTMALCAGTVICLRAFEPKRVFDLIEEHEITHFGGAPIVLNMLANAPQEHQKVFDRKISVMTAGAPPPASVLESMGKFGFDVLHVYGLTESYGHALMAAPQENWMDKTQVQQAELKSRQGVCFSMTDATDILDAETGDPVPHDGESMGEIVMRGNIMMKGYLKDADATSQAFKGGWFYTGDLGVIYPDGYIQIKDRAKDIIISGGENISSVEIENVLYKHPAVGEAAVVAMADEKWGEVPCAFVELKDGMTADADDLIGFCGENMARFKRPKRIVFGELPRTATGKIQKTVLREKAKIL
jgi:fatty-acyl-CoA synthase